MLLTFDFPILLPLLPFSLPSLSSSRLAQMFCFVCRFVSPIYPFPFRFPFLLFVCLFYSKEYSISTVFFSSSVSLLFFSLCVSSFYCLARAPVSHTPSLAPLSFSLSVHASVPFCCSFLSRSCCRPHPHAVHALCCRASVRQYLDDLPLFRSPLPLLSSSYPSFVTLCSVKYCHCFFHSFFSFLLHARPVPVALVPQAKRVWLTSFFFPFSSCPTVLAIPPLNRPRRNKRPHPRPRSSRALSLRPPRSLTKVKTTTTPPTQRLLHPGRTGHLVLPRTFPSSTTPRAT